ncbi:MAG: rod shape-determining protein MreC [Gemmatimonadetes bacterium]|nr:rod shape-determining protein MreC [Gemmatimonadota bacterium]
MAALRTGRRPEIVAAALVAASVVILALPEPTQNSLARRANHVVLLPLARVRAALSGYVRLRDENARLHDALGRARLELAETRTLRAQNRELRRLLDFRANQPVRLLPARVIDRDFGTLPTTFVIDAGSEDGVEENLPVVTSEGLVGKTVDVGLGSTQVMLYTHPEFSASALLVGGDHLEYGIVRPAPDGRLRLFLPLRSYSEAGETIVTSGYGGVFPRGIAIGRVSQTHEDDRLGLQRIDSVEPVVDLGRVSAVFAISREGDPNRSAGEVTRLFWPGYAYPPMAGETFGRADTAAVADTTARETSGRADTTAAADTTAGEDASGTPAP